MLYVLIALSTPARRIDSSGVHGLSPVGSPGPEFVRWSSSGLPGSWEVLSYLCLAQKTPAAPPSPLPRSKDGLAPATSITKAAALIIFSRLVHIASVLAVYASSFGFPTLARLASGRVAALTGWVSNPLDFKGEFQSGYVSPDIPTPQALPGATMFDVRRFRPSPSAFRLPPKAHSLFVIRSFF